MRRLWMALFVFFLMGSYTAYQIDLDCHLSGFVQSVVQHAAEPDDCAAPSALDAPYVHVVCPLLTVCPTPTILEMQESAPRLLGLEDEPRPNTEECSRQVGPPRAPPQVLT